MVAATAMAVVATTLTAFMCSVVVWTTHCPVIVTALQPPPQSPLLLTQQPQLSHRSSTRGYLSHPVSPLQRRHNRKQSFVARSVVAANDNVEPSLSLSPLSSSPRKRQRPSLAGPIFGVIKAMVGTGMLALPSGLAAVTNHPTGLWPAHALLLVVTVLSAYTFLLYGRLTHATQATSLGELWRRVHTTNAPTTSSSTTTTTTTAVVSGKQRTAAVTSTSDTITTTTTAAAAASSDSSGRIVSLVSFVFCFGACLTFSLVFGDLGSSFLRGSTTLSSLLPAWALTRHATILTVTLAVLFPLCNLSSLVTALAPVSILGVVGTVLTTAFLAWRCPSVVASSPSAIPGLGLLTDSTGSISSTLMHQPSFSTYSRMDTPAPLVLVAMSCVALMAHFNAPDFYHAMTAGSGSTTTTTTGSSDTSVTKEVTPLDARAKPETFEDGNVMNRFAIVTLVGYSVVALLNSLTLTFGYLTFGGACQGIILNNYSSHDWGANASRLLVAVSVIGSYPLLMTATRSAALELFASHKTVTRRREFRMTAILLSVITAISLVVKDAGFVLSFNGALMGSSIVYTIPALLFLKQMDSRISSGAVHPTRLVRLEQRICRLLVVFGVVSALVGGTTTVISSFFAHLLH
jgi:amino acid permease